MVKPNTQFEAFLAEEVAKYRDTYFPIRASRLTRLLVRHARCDRLHPNPEDEFCMPSIGPSYEIIDRYMAEYRMAEKSGLQREYCDEPIIVEKIYPDGYLILNGHHRWAAAKRMGYKKIWVQIVNLTQESDIKKRLSASKNDRRVTLDLDEVVFCPEGEAAEAALPFPLNKFYTERLRRGIPALFNLLDQSGYDVWLYTRQYRSVEHVRHLFERYHARITGVITGAGRKTRIARDAKKAVDALFAGKYRTTLNINADAVVRIASGTKSVEEYPVSSGGDWARQVIDVVKELQTHEG